MPGSQALGTKWIAGIAEAEMRHAMRIGCYVPWVRDIWLLQHKRGEPNAKERSDLTLSEYFENISDIWEVRMSDGPYRSLNMNCQWRRVAQYADNPAFSQDEVARAFVPALDRCCEEEVPSHLWRTLLGIFSAPQDTLFPEQRADQVRALRHQVGGRPLACLLIDSAALAASKGPATEETLIDAAVRALSQRGARANKQVEEHWYRASNERRTEQMRKRLENALICAPLTALARQHVMNMAMPDARRSAKQKGLEDGVQL